MRIPKRYKIHEAAASELRLSSSGFIARGPASVVSVPVIEHGFRLEDDLPRMEPGERRETVPIDPRAMQAATQGAKGEGLLRLVRDPAKPELVVGSHAWAGGDKPWVTYGRPDCDPDEHDDAVKTIFAEACAPPKINRIGVEVCLNAQILAQVAAAIGASDGEIRLKFHIDPVDGRCDTDRGLIEVRPVNDPKDGAYGVLMAVAAP